MSKAIPNPKAPDQTCYCSFCGKSQHEVSKLIAGPGAYICDEDVLLCLEILVHPRPIKFPDRKGDSA